MTDHPTAALPNIPSAPPSEVVIDSWRGASIVWSGTISEYSEKNDLTRAETDAILAAIGGGGEFPIPGQPGAALRLRYFAPRPGTDAGDPVCPKCGSEGWDQFHHHGDFVAPECWWWECDDCGHRTEPE